MKQSSPLRDILTGLILLAALGFGVYWLLAALIDKLASIEGDLGKTLVTASVTILVAAFSIVGGKLWEQKLKIREDIRSKKILVYEKQIGTFFSLLMSEKIRGTKLTEQELTKAFAEFSEKLIIWGSSDVIRAWVRFRTGDPKTRTMQETFTFMNDLFLAIRKDVGNENRNLADHELIRLFVNDLVTIQVPASVLYCK